MFYLLFNAIIFCIFYYILMFYFLIFFCIYYIFDYYYYYYYYYYYTFLCLFIYFYYYFFRNVFQQLFSFSVIWGGDFWRHCSNNNVFAEDGLLFLDRCCHPVADWRHDMFLFIISFLDLNFPAEVSWSFWPQFSFCSSRFHFQLMTLKIRYII